MIEIGQDIIPDPTAKVVLLVEDEVLVRMYLAMTLRDVGFFVVEACHADEAIDVVRSGIRPHALVTDVRMPGSMDGLQLAQHMSTELQDLVVVVTSAHLAATSEVAEVQHFFPKPYNAIDVATRVVSLLHEAGAAAPAQQRCA